MSALSTLGINKLLGDPNDLLKQTFSTTTPPKLLKKHYSGHEDYHEEYHYTKKKSRGIALTALTLLAFLFFLHILQQCLHDQIEMQTTTTPSTLLVQANIQAKNDIQDVGKNVPRDSNNRADDDDLEVTTTSVDEDKIKNEDLYWYDKIHVPIKTKTVQSVSRIKKF